ncbi:MAG: cytochrome-c oxidase, cbb3-type subunit III [Gammaproteobacteria bacterium]|nr:cytochrome-c oxidase, cbb3-type subunit III [Gammaproteobacteria bacterium]
MADFVSEFWSWFIIIPTVIGILAMFPLVYFNRGQKQSGEADKMGHSWDEDLEEYNNPLPGWWLNLFYITIVFGIIYLILYPGLGSFGGVLGWSSTQRYQNELEYAEERYGPIFEKYQQTDIRTLARNDDAMRAAERLYANYCAQCHGSDARGAPGYPNLRDDNWLWGGEPEQIRETIANGRTGVMPGWEDALGEEGLFNVTEYVLSLSGRQHDSAVAEKGKARYEQLCVACHGPDGTGNTAMGAPNLTNRTWLYGGAQKTVMESIAKGRQGHMPPHGEFLGDSKVHLLSAYVYHLSAQHEQQ